MNVLNTILDQTIHEENCSSRVLVVFWVGISVKWQKMNGRFWGRFFLILLTSFRPSANL